MASMNNAEAHQPGSTPEDKVNKILETLPELNKLLSSQQEEEDPFKRNDPLKRNKEEVNNRMDILARSLSAPPALTHVASNGKLIPKLIYQFQLLKLTLGRLERFQTNVGVELDKHLGTLQKLVTDLDSSRGSSQTTTYRNLEGIDKKMFDFLNQVPLLSGKLEKQKTRAYGDEDDEDGAHQDKADDYLPGIHTHVGFLVKCEAFRQVKHTFMELEIERKICLLSFAVFPENREVHRTVLMYWWIGEGILPVLGAEEAVREVLKDFTDKNLVEPVEDRRKMAPNSYKMTSFVHASVIHLSKEIKLFDIYGGKYNNPRTSKSEMGKVCLVEGSQAEIAPEKMLRETETVFNVSARDLDFTVEWFSKNPHKYGRFMINSSEAWFKSLNVFYLGRWERTKKPDIQVQNHELMKCLKHVTSVKVLSLQGISTIKSLNSSVCKLHQLIILDLRDCCGLTKLPEKIDSVQNLVYLDMTGCYMLEWIPIRVALLKNLEVLKGFVVSEDLYEGVACKLKYLQRLKKLRKLSIEIDRDDDKFNVGNLVEDIVELKALTSLKVTWRKDMVIFNRTVKVKPALKLVRSKTFLGPEHGAIAEPRPGISSNLKKLNLQRYPEERLHERLLPRNLLHLEKLHIGGAKRLKNFGSLPEEERRCGVKVLRLTSLPKLSVGWLDLKEFFPNLKFLEKYECPRVTLTPCDGNGIWRSDQDCSTKRE